MNDFETYTDNFSEGDLIPFKLHQPKHKKVLVFAPHPDDETLGCGGTLLQHSHSGDDVRVIFLTDGGRGDDNGNYQEQEYISLRENEALNALRVLGIKSHKFCRFQDRNLGRDRNHFKLIKSEIENYKPGIIYVTSPIEINPDHRASAHLVWNAINSLKIKVQLAFYEVSTPLNPNIIVDISPFVEQKIQAAACYPSQMSLINYSEIAIALNRFRSLTVSNRSEFAEAFILNDSKNIIGTYLSDKYSLKCYF